MQAREILLKLNEEKIKAYQIFIDKVEELYLRGMEYQHIWLELWILKSDFSSYRTGKKIPSLQKLRECNEKLKKL